MHYVNAEVTSCTHSRRGGGIAAPAGGLPVLALKSQHSKRKRRKKSDTSAAATASGVLALGRSRSKSDAAAEQQWPQF